MKASSLTETPVVQGGHFGAAGSRRRSNPTLAQIRAKAERETYEDKDDIIRTWLKVFGEARRQGDQATMDEAYAALEDLNALQHLTGRKRNPKAKAEPLTITHKTSGNALRLYFEGTVGRIPVQGHTQSYMVGIDAPPDHEHVVGMTINRTDKSGEVPMGARMKVEKAVLAHLKKMVGGGAKTRSNPTLRGTTKVFSGKKYAFYSLYWTKAEAETEAKRQRDLLKFEARVVKYTGGGPLPWALYVHPYRNGAKTNPGTALVPYTNPKPTHMILMMDDGFGYTTEKVPIGSKVWDVKSTGDGEFDLKPYQVTVKAGMNTSSTYHTSQRAAQRGIDEFVEDASRESSLYGGEYDPDPYY